MNSLGCNYCIKWSRWTLGLLRSTSIQPAMDGKSYRTYSSTINKQWSPHCSKARPESMASSIWWTFTTYDWLNAEGFVLSCTENIMTDSLFWRSCWCAICRGFCWGSFSFAHCCPQVQLNKERQKTNPKRQVFWWQIMDIQNKTNGIAAWTGAMWG